MRRQIIFFALFLLTGCAFAVDPGRDGPQGTATGSRQAQLAEADCFRNCGGQRGRPLPDVQASQAKAKADVERQVAELHARLRAAQASFAQSRGSYDLLGVRLGDPQSRVASLLSKEFPNVKADKQTGSGSYFECAPRTSSSRRNGDCVGIETKPNGDPNAINTQKRQINVFLNDKGRVHGLHYKQSNLFVANTLEGCERERDLFMAGVASKNGQPFSKSIETLTWGAAMPMADFQRAYSNNHHTLMGVVKSLDGDMGLVNDSQRVIYFQGGFALTAKCYGSNGGSISMGIDAFLSDSRLEEQDRSGSITKPKL